MIDILENKVGMTSISKYDYTVNSLGQRTARANTGTAFGTTSTDDFSYNAKGEITGTTNATIPAYDRTFAYDDIGNRTSATDNVGTTSYTANTLNAYTAIGAASPTHDADGNQTSTGTGQLYTWDAENRLITVEPALPLTSDQKQINTYDGQSRRVRKQVYTYTGSAWSLITDEKFIYDGWNVVAVLNAASSNALLRTYTWGLDLSGSLQGAGGVGGLLSAKDGSSVYHYTYDANGNVSEVLNNSGGIAAHYEYDAFGNTVASSGTYATTNAYRFSTKPLDSVSELYYYGFRYYNPNIGRWLNRDPIEEEGGLNLYGFVNNNGVNEVDVLGREIAGNVLDVIKSAIPHKIDVFYRDWRVGVWPVPVMPAVTVELYVQVDVDIVNCCKKGGGVGYMAVGYFGLELNGGVGTSIGGTSNVRAQKGRNGVQYRNGSGGGVGRGGSYASKPTVQNYGTKSSTSVRGATGVGLTGSMPSCETSLSFIARIGISGFVTGGIGRFSAGAQFDTQFGECRVPGGCNFTNPLKNGSAGSVFGLGSGARIQVYGRGGIEGKVAL